MKNVPLRVLGVLALLSVGWVWAAGPSATVTWTAPTAYIDGTVLPASDIDHYTVTPAGGTSITTKTLSAVVPVACGSVAFSVTATTTATAAYPNTTSAPAGPVTYVSGVGCAPNPPDALAVH
jgi:hypothetical protein